MCFGCYQSTYCVYFESLLSAIVFHDDVIKWKHFPRYWPFVRGIHRYPVNSPHKGQWRGAVMFTLICARINGWVNNIEAGDLRRYLPHYDVIVMFWSIEDWSCCSIYQANDSMYFNNCQPVVMYPVQHFWEGHFLNLKKIFLTNSLHSENNPRHIWLLWYW